MKVCCAASLTRSDALVSAESKERNWLNETDMDFFTGGGPSEAEGAPGASEEEGAVVRRRLLLGVGLAVAAGAFALVPTEKLQAPPAKPLFFYLVPLVRVEASEASAGRGGIRASSPSRTQCSAHASRFLPQTRVQALLDEAERIIPDGNYEALRALLARIQGAPNNIQDNLRSAAACEPPPRLPACLPACPPRVAAAANAVCNPALCCRSARQTVPPSCKQLIEKSHTN